MNKEYLTKRISQRPMEYLQNVEILYFYMVGKSVYNIKVLRKKKPCGVIVVITTSMPKRENQSHLSLAVALNVVLGRYCNHIMLSRGSARTLNRRQVTGFRHAFLKVEKCKQNTI